MTHEQSEGDNPMHTHDSTQMTLTQRPDIKMASIKPYPKSRDRIRVIQARMYDPHQMSGLGDWGRPMIEWPAALAATAEDAEAMIAGLEEALRLYRQWEHETHR